MAFDPHDAVTARALLEDALALTSRPTLSPEQVDRAFGLAETLDEDGESIVYPADALDRAAAWGWGIKAGLTADMYDLGGGPGRTLDRSQWHAHCKSMQRDYASGVLSVVPRLISRRSGLGSIELLGPLAEDTP
jgi:hypothetical protein